MLPWIQSSVFFTTTLRLSPWNPRSPRNRHASGLRSPGRIKTRNLRLHVVQRSGRFIGCSYSRISALLKWRLHFTMLDHSRQDGRDGRQAKLRATSIAEHRKKFSAFLQSNHQPSNHQPSSLPPLKPSLISR